MILDRIVEIQSYTATKDAYGHEVKTWSPIATVAANTQPTGATESQQQRYGIVDRTLYRVFFEPQTITESDRIIDPEFGVLRILEVHSWGNHTEVWGVKRIE